MVHHSTVVAVARTEPVDTAERRRQTSSKVVITINRLMRCTEAPRSSAVLRMSGMVVDVKATVGRWSRVVLPVSELPTMGTKITAKGRSTTGETAFLFINIRFYLTTNFRRMLIKKTAVENRCLPKK
ncbi:unnamed protein product [Dibothriocephalus latus]|uniref:Uncharacterized protein n=1 Tax=Dibothriocephalus latus TaxID=60516 RepID=A0A3P7NLJ9_DIBLA|nr:unnamed protein product [Dibothriocephalus latus]